MLEKILKVYYLSKAFKLASENKVIEPLDILNKNEGFFQKNANKFLDFFILRGSLYFEAHEYALAEDNLQIASEMLKDTDEFNIDEKKYLLSYIYILIANIKFKIKDKSWVMCNEAAKKNDYNINNIRKTLMLNFPIASFS